MIAREPGDDLIALLRDAAKELAPGELVMAPGVTCESLMNAIEIGDPRMDMGVVTDAQRSQPAFEPERLLSAEDVLAVMDRLFACEMCFIDGHALAATVYTCLYTQGTDRYALAALPGNGPHPPQLVGLVLRSYVMATLKICDMLWLELVRGNLREGEDVWTDKAGVSLLEETSPDEVLGLLDEANEWLQNALELDDALREQMMARLIFSTELFYTLCMLADPTSTLDGVLGRLHDTITVFDRVDSIVPQGEVPPGVFDPHVGRNLQTHQPPRPVTPISFAAAHDVMRTFLDDFVAVLELVTQSRGWADWSLAFTFFGRRPVPASPCIRSLLQSLFSADGDLCSAWPLRRLADIFCGDVGGLPAACAEKLGDKAADEQYGEATKDLRRDWRSFTDALAGRLASHLCTFGADRSRQMRKLAQAVPEWAKLRTRLERLGPSLDVYLAEEQVRTRTRHLLLAFDHVVLLASAESVLSGFELELYAAKEWRATLWAAEHIQRRNARVLDDLLRSRPTPALTVQRDLALVVATLCHATVLLITLAGMDTTSGFADGEMLRLRFERRFDHLAVATEWRGYAAAMDVIAARSRDQQIEELARTLGEAAAPFDGLKIGLISIGAIGAGHCAPAFTGHLYALGKTVQMAQGALRSLQAGRPIRLIEQNERSCPWFPLFGM